jgi:hypothetical protein
VLTGNNVESADVSFGADVRAVTVTPASADA